jgi:hypothetical protein
MWDDPSLIFIEMHMREKKKRYIFVFFKICALALCLYAFKHLAHFATDGFTISKITSNLKYHPEWEVQRSSDGKEELLQANLPQILNQKFHYLSKGAQCYAFVSDDGMYVLKFFRFQHLTPNTFLTHLPFPHFLKKWRDGKIAKRENKLNQDFSSYKLAFEELKNECGLMFIHLNKTSNFLHPITLVDKIKIEHQVDLDQFEFILQRRAKLVYPQIQQWMEVGDARSAKRAISELLQLVALKGERGIVDVDPNLSKNFGFIDGKPIQIDVGRFEKKSSCDHSVFQGVLRRMHDDFIYWLNKHYPVLSEHFEEQYQEKIVKANI